MKTILEKIDMLLENEAEDKAKAKDIVAYATKKYKGDYKKIHRHIMDNVVNNPYTRNSNNFVETVWKELGKKFPS